MRSRNAWRAGVLGVVLVAAAACSDADSPTFAPPEGARAEAAGVQIGKPGTWSPYLCHTSVATPGGEHRYRYGRLSLIFPGHAIRDDRSSRLRYRIRVVDGDGTILRAANCVIPASRAAVQMMNRRFGAPRNAGFPAHDPRGEAIAIQGDFYLAPIVIEACTNPDWIKDDGGTCRPPDSPPPDGGDPWGGYDDGTGGGGTGNHPEPDEPCDTGDPVIDSAPVQHGFDQLWKASNPDANLAQRKERGGWIVQENGQHRVEEWTNVTISWCGIDGVVPFPASGVVVGFVHTHPYAIGETVVTCDFRIVEYRGIPSDEDRMMSVSLGQQLGYPGGLPGYIIDADRITRFQGATNANDARHDRCGY